MGDCHARIRLQTAVFIVFAVIVAPAAGAAEDQTGAGPESPAAQSLTAPSPEGTTPAWIDAAGRDLQQVVDAAPPFSVIRCDPSRRVTISRTVVIRKPLTLVGLNARLPDGLKKTPILEVFSEHFRLTDFRLLGNNDTVTQKGRCALVRLHAGDFRVERGVFENCTKDGVEVDPREEIGHIVGGVIRDIVGRNVTRDVVSINAGMGKGPIEARHILVENIRGYDSELRGPVEVSDGTDHTTVRKIYAENCVYAIDVQDHSKEGQINRNVLIEDVYALRCRHAVRTQNHPFGHSNLTLRGITAKECEQSIRVSHTDRVTIDDVRILGNTGVEAIKIENCRGVNVRDVRLVGGAADATGLLILDCSDATVDGVSLSGKPDVLAAAVRYRIARGGAFSNLRIQGVFAKHVRDAGIVLEKRDEGATLEDYIVCGNVSRVSDGIGGRGATIFGNVPPRAANHVVPAARPEE